VTEDEVSPGGSRIFRHEAADEEPPFSGGDAAVIEAVTEHLDHCFGDLDRDVFHEIVSTTVHVDVHHVPPSDEFPFNRLVTSGMSELPMTAPEGMFDEPLYAELTLALPADWPLTQEDFDDERHYWPIRVLKQLARLPHEYSTFLWYGHTIPNGDPPEPYADGTELSCALLIPPLTVPDEFRTLDLGDGRTVQFLGVTAVTRDEMELKLKRGFDALVDLFDDRGLADLIDPKRPSVVQKRKGFFRR
jgi:hypothetical protein